MEFSDRQPIYKQISDYFCRQILEKSWQPGDRVPSVREVAVQLEVNPNTAMRAFQILQEQGILENRRGVGHFISDDAFDKTLDMQRKEFIQLELPMLFRKMKLLGFSYTELERIYKG